MTLVTVKDKKNIESFGLKIFQKIIMNLMMKMHIFQSKSGQPKILQQTLN